MFNLLSLYCALLLSLWGFCFLQFLSMKLTAVNPRMEFNVEGILAKDVSPVSLQALSKSQRKTCSTCL